AAAARTKRVIARLPLTAGTCVWGDSRSTARSTMTSSAEMTASTPSHPFGVSVAVSEPLYETVVPPTVRLAPNENHAKNSRSITSSSARPPTIQSSRLTLSRFTGTPPEEHGGQATDSSQVVHPSCRHKVPATDRKSVV